MIECIYWGFNFSIPFIIPLSQESRGEEVAIDLTCLQQKHLVMVDGFNPLLTE